MKTNKELNEKFEALKIAGVNLNKKFESYVVQQKMLNEACYWACKAVDKWSFANQAIIQTCDAFFREDFFSFQEGEAGQEYYPDLSCGEKLPEAESWNGTIQGIFHFLTESASDLWLVCSYFAEKGEDFFVFYEVNDIENKDENGWVVWLPNAKHLN